jgi:putative phosphoribosyl transferase
VQFTDRHEAGRRLAADLGPWAGGDTLVLGLPRGGVPVAEEVARALRAPLDVCLVRKLGVPAQPELAMGAIGEDGVRVLNDDVLRMARVAPDALEAVEERERAALQRRSVRYRDGRPPLPVEGRTVLVVDDGVATGATERAACQVVRARGARRIVVAVPVAPPGWEQRFAGVADACVCPYTPAGFTAIGQFYDDFAQVDDAEVAAARARAGAFGDGPRGDPDGGGQAGDPAAGGGPEGGGQGGGPRDGGAAGGSPEGGGGQGGGSRGGGAAGGGPEGGGGAEGGDGQGGGPREDGTAGGSPEGGGTADAPGRGAGAVVARDVVIPAGSARLAGELTVPAGAGTVVVFAHGSGSGRHSTRNRFVAHHLNRAGLGTLLFDLLTPAEEADRGLAFDIPLLAGRLGAAIRRLRAEPGARGLDVACYGASTGAAAALWAAADSGLGVTAIVSRGGRPDLAEPRLGLVSAPTLLIVGGHDPAVLNLNRQAQARLRCPSELAIVPGAGHLFEEPGTLRAVADLARDWFTGRRPATGGSRSA